MIKTPLAWFGGIVAAWLGYHIAIIMYKTIRKDYEDAKNLHEFYSARRKDCDHVTC